MKFFIIFILSSIYIISASPLYKQCASCHGVKGEKQSLNKTGPIAGMKVKEVVDALEQYKAGTLNKYGFGKMMEGQSKKLSLDDMKEIALHIETFPPVKVVKVKKVKAKEVSVERLFKKCSACHGKKGEKKSLGVSKIIAGMKADTIIEELEDYKKGEKNLYGFGKMMRGQTTKLSHEDIVKIAKYIESLPVVKSEDDKKEPTRELTKEELEYNKFMGEYFRDSKDPNETFEAAKKSYKEYQNRLKEKNE